MWDHMQGYGGMGFGWGFGLIIWLLLLVGIIIGIKWLVSSSGNGVHAPTAMEILKQRYARGEISEEEYRKMKKEIQSGD